MSVIDDQLSHFVRAAEAALGDDLLSLVLFGSAAEGRLRPTSDVNVLLLLKRFDRTRMDQLREPLRLAHAAIRLAPMFILHDELEPATRAFAVKFREIKRRRRILHGSDPFKALEVSRASSVLRLRQELLNLALRLRQTYMLRSLREEQLVSAIADAAGPLRAAAATLIELKGEPPLPPKEALERLAGEIRPADDGLLASMSQAREQRELPAGEAGTVLLGLVDLASELQRRAESLTL